MSTDVFFLLKISDGTEQYLNLFLTFQVGAFDLHVQLAIGKVASLHPWHGEAEKWAKSAIWAHPATAAAGT